MLFLPGAQYEICFCFFNAACRAVVPGQPQGAYAHATKTCRLLSPRPPKPSADSFCDLARSDSANTLPGVEFGDPCGRAGVAASRFKRIAPGSHLCAVGLTRPRWPRAADPLHRAWIDTKTLGDAAYAFTSALT